MTDHAKQPTRIRTRTMGPAASPSGSGAQALLKRERANELFIAIVGPVGAGGGTAARAIKRYLEQERVDGSAFDVHIVKASDRIKRWATEKRLPLPPSGRKSVEGIKIMQDRGDDLRRQSGDNAAVARLVIDEISETRASASGSSRGFIDGKPRAYIIDSLRHPAEAHLLRRLYQDAFTLVGVVCEPSVREERIKTELFDPKDRRLTQTEESVRDLLERDADAPEIYGQHVIDTFHESDFFVDNSKNAFDVNNTSMNEDLLRFVGLITSREIERPTIAETAMHHAFSGKLKSACLSRQVGAALVDKGGNIVATGTNEVPKAGGGVYGDSFEHKKANDQRCAFRETKFCSSNVEQNNIIQELMDDFPELTESADPKNVLKRLRKTRIGGLIEFSRAVHAEMDAILGAARVGVSPCGCRLFVSTFPYHYCARHIVAAGIDEVVYIEPYPKSQALRLHSDAIANSPEEWSPPSDGEGGKVLFRPFVGVAPRMYARVFLKDRDYKDKISGNFDVGQPDWGGPADIFKVRYTDLEADLGKISV